MADISTVWDTETGTGGWALDPSSQVIWVDQDGNGIVDQHGNAIGTAFRAGNGLLAGGELVSAVLISLFTDAAAGDDDILPDASNDPRGWWGGEIGSKLWLRARSKATPLTAALVKNDIVEALAWMITDQVVAAIDVTVEWQSAMMLGASVVLRRQDGARAALRFSRLWESV